MCVPLVHRVKVSAGLKVPGILYGKDNHHIGRFLSPPPASAALASTGSTYSDLGSLG